MTRRFVLSVLAALAALAAPACAPAQEGLYEDGAYQSYLAFDGPAFMPDAPIEVVELVWLEAGDSDEEHFAAVPEQERCLGADDRDRCDELLLDAVAEVVSLGIERRNMVHTLANELCINCATELGYLFAVSNDMAWVVNQAEAIEIFGEIDTPAEAIVVLGEYAPVRQIEGGFELVTTSDVCNPDGPRRTTWTVDVDGTISPGVDWMENSGEDCNDI